MMQIINTHILRSKKNVDFFFKGLSSKPRVSFVSRRFILVIYFFLFGLFACTFCRWVLACARVSLSNTLSFWIAYKREMMDIVLFKFYCLRTFWHFFRDTVNDKIDLKLFWKPNFATWSKKKRFINKQKINLSNIAFTVLQKTIWP